MGLQIKKYILAIIFCAGNSGLLASQDLSDRVERNATWNLEKSMSMSKDEAIIALLSQIKNMQEKLWIEVFDLAMDAVHLKLRTYLFTRFHEDFPFPENNKKIYDKYILLCGAEYRDFTGKSLPDESDQARILMVLRNIKKWKMKELFYETSSLMAYPIQSIRKEANETMAVIMDDRIFPIVLKLSQSENPVERTYALDSLFYLKDERMVPVLFQLLSDKNKSVRYYALRTLEILDSQESTPYYIRILRSDVNDEVRIMSANILSKTRHPYAFNPLLETLGDPSPDLRRAVLNALNEYGYAAAAPVISRQLSLETEKDLKIKEINALLKLNNSGMMVGLNHILRNEKDVTVRLWAVYATGKLLDYNGFDALLENLTNPVPEIREEAALALSGYRNRRSMSTLLNLVRGEKQPYRVKAAALYALKTLDDNNSFPDLYDFSVNHEYIEVKAEVKVILKDMIDRRFK